MIARLVEGVPAHALALLALVAAVLVAAPFIVSSYVLSVLIVALYFAYAGQAWNVMMGFAGQLSLGHSLYVGVAAYAAATLFVNFGVAPWIGLLPAILVAAAFAAAIGFLAFRFGISGVYFALLTIAFAEFTRIGFDHFSYVGGSGGLFIPVGEDAGNDVLALRGSPTMFYYVMLALASGAFVLCRALLRSRMGYYWMAIREDQEAAQSLGVDAFRCKMAAVVVSSAMTALAGVFSAFYYRNLFPQDIFSIGRSIEIILGPIIGGLGTLFGPILGAFVLQILAESLREVLGHFGIEIPGLTQVFYGLCLLVVIMFLPHGIWPWLARHLRLAPR